MKVYRINIHSTKRAIIFATVVFPIVIYTITLVPNGWPEVLRFATIAVLFYGQVYPITLLSKGRIRIELTENSFRMIWLKRFLFSREPDVELTWDRIIDYVDQSDRGFDSFYMTLSDEERFRINRFNHFPQKDDFEKFLRQFPKFINARNAVSSARIEQGKTEFQTPAFKRSLILLTILLLGLVLNWLFNPNSSARWSSLAMLATAILFYWAQAFRKTRNEQ